MASLSPEAERAIEAAGARAPQIEDIPRRPGVTVIRYPARMFSRDAAEGPGGVNALQEQARRAMLRQERFRRAAERAAARAEAGPARDQAAERAARAAMAAAQEAAKAAREKRRLAALVAEGLTPSEIAERLGVTRGTVYRHLGRHGLKARAAPRGARGAQPARLPPCDAGGGDG